MTATDRNGRSAGAVFCMPSPAVVSASAEWIVTANWARAAELRLGAAVVEVGGEIEGFRGTRTRAPMRRPIKPRLTRLDGRVRLLWLRTVLADCRKGWRNLTQSWKPLPRLSMAPVFVWEYHSPFFRRGRALAAALGCPLVRFVAAPQVWEARRWGIQRGWWGRAVERLGEIPALRAADLVCCVSSQVREAVLGIAALSPQRVIVTPNTSPAAEMIASRADRQAMRREWGLPEEAVVVGWTGSFRGFHDLDFLLEAIERVEPPTGEWCVVLLGEGSTKEKVAEAARRRGLPVRCVDAVPHSRMPAALAAFDLAVLPLRSADRFHYSPLKLREYSAAGLPTVAPDVGDSRHLFGEDAAELYPPGDAGALARALSRLLNDAAVRDTLSRSVACRHALRGETGLEIDQVLGALRQLGWKLTEPRTTRGTGGGGRPDSRG